MNRSEQNQALKDWDFFLSTARELDPMMRELLLRNRFSTGQRRRFRGELGEMDGEPEPHYSDPTGDEAVWSEKRDRIGDIITYLAKDLGRCHTTAEWLIEIGNESVVQRAERSVPDCLACGEPSPGRIVGGFDDKCYKRWQRAGRPDRLAFIRETRQQQDNKKQQELASE